MEIWVELQNGKLSFSPDPAVVKKGARVSWRFRSHDTRVSKRIRWNVYFSGSSPFVSFAPPFSTTTSGEDGEHVGATGAASAEQPGDYKYGVRAEDTIEQVTLADEDPHLIVQP